MFGAVYHGHCNWRDANWQWFAGLRVGAGSLGHGVGEAVASLDLLQSYRLSRPVGRHRGRPSGADESFQFGGVVGSAARKKCPLRGRLSHDERGLDRGLPRTDMGIQPPKGTP